MNIKLSPTNCGKVLPVEDLVKKLPGLTVDKDGNVTAQGKAVTKVRVRGGGRSGGGGRGRN